MERTNEQTLELFADLLDPCCEIVMDDEIGNLIKNNASKIKIAQTAIRKHKESIIAILAMLEGEDPKEYKINMFLLPIKVIKFLNMPEVQELFPSQGRKINSGSSGSATANIEVVES